jgi:hypothetical protein
MSDALHFDPSADSSRLDGLDVYARIEELLLVGLDHYFAGRHEQAIHVWTRVLFLDRGHARARAYIERARSALAERQRESEELLHHGVDAFHRGDAGAARQLLTSAVERGAPQDEALAVLGRLDRLEAAAAASLTHVPTRRERRELEPAPVAAPEERPRGIGLVVLFTVVLVLVGVTAVVVTYGDAVGHWFLFEEVEQAAPSPARIDRPLVVPSATEAALARARSLAARGHFRRAVVPSAADCVLLREALRALDAVAVGDSRRAEADELRAEIQRTLLAAAEPSPAASGGGTTTR